jgi:hypothetical protein
MAYEFDDPMSPIVTREMLAAKIEALRSSAFQLEGHELGRAYRLICSIAERPYQFNINGPLHILPDRTGGDVINVIVGPDPLLPRSIPRPGNTAGPTVDCPNCGHQLKIRLSL